MSYPAATNLPVTDLEFVVWALSAPSQGYDYMHPNTVEWGGRERSWLRATLKRSPMRVRFEVDGFFLNSFIRCWTVLVNGVCVGRIRHHEYISLLPYQLEELKND
jgi:hypothetical protein